MTRFVGTPLRGIEFSSVSDEAISARVNGDGHPRIRIDAGGRITWSSGSAAGDVILERTDENVLSLGSGDTFKTPVLFVDDIEIDTTGAASGQVLKFNGVKFVPSADATGEGGSSNLDDLLDVVIASASTGEVLQFDGTNWVNSSISIDELSDVVITTAANQDLLQFNGTSWVNTSSLDYVQFDSSVGSPTAAEGKLQWDSDFGTLSVGLEGNNSLHHLGMNQFAYCYNAEATTLNKGEVVYIFGGQGSQVSVKRASNVGDPTSSKTLGVVSESIASSGSGYVCTYGVLQGLDTSGYTEGAILYLGETAGTLTATEPVTPSHTVFVGVVIKADNSGELWIRPQNGYEIGELHDVLLTDVASGDFLKYDGSKWVNDAINLGTDTVGNYVSDVSAGTGISVTHTPSEGSTATVALSASIDDLSDVVITTPSTGQTIVYDGSNWVNTPVMPSGSITQFAGSSAPTGWLTCDGSNVSRTTYSALFAVIGTTYGAGDGSTTFTLPNLKGRTPVGLDSGQTEFDALGETGGAKTHTLTTSEMPSHTHTQDAHNHTQNAHNHSTNGAGGHSHTVYGLNTGIPSSTNPFGVGMLRINDGGYNYATTGVGDHSHSVNNTTPTNNATTATNQNTGGGAAHNNLQPYIVLNYIIKV